MRSRVLWYSVLTYSGWVVPNKSDFASEDFLSGFLRIVVMPIGGSAKTRAKLQLQLRSNGHNDVAAIYHSNFGKSDPFCMAECSQPENSPRIQNLHDDRFVHPAATQCTIISCINATRSTVLYVQPLDVKVRKYWG